MKQIIKILGVFVLLTMVVSCAEDRNELQDIPRKGALISISNSTPGIFDLANPAAAANSFTINEYRGEALSSAKIYKSFNGGDKVEVGTVSSFPATFSATLAETVAGLGVNVSDLMLGDAFEFSFDLVTSSGTYPSSTKVTVPMSCISALAGSYTATSSGTSTDPCCPGTATATTTVTLTDTGGGNYDISDWSGGMYFEWYDVYGMTADGTPGAVFDLCNDINYTTTSEPYGESLTGSGSVDPGTGVITLTWSNGWGDQGTTTLTPQ